MHTTWLCYAYRWEDQALVVSSWLPLIGIWKRPTCCKQIKRLILADISFYYDVLIQCSSAYVFASSYCLLFCSVVASNGLWVAPGNSEEVAAALSQALRNSLERYSCIFLIIVAVRNHRYFCWLDMNIPGFFLVQITKRAFVCKVWWCFYKIQPPYKKSKQL